MRFRSTVFILTGFIGTASAHETWLLPSAFEAKVGQEVRFDLTSGMEFPAPGNPIEVERVSKAAYRLGKSQSTGGKLEAKEKSLSLTQSFPRAGLATVWVELRPRDIELTDDLVAEYLDEIGATSQTRALWARQKGRSVWKESYTKHAKAFVAVGDASRDRSWQKGVGMALEIVPVTDPLALRAGEDLTVELRRREKPIAGVPVGLLVRGSDRVFKTTDATGRVTFPVSHAGEAMLFSVDLRPAADGSSWKSDFTNLTLRVR